MNNPFTQHPHSVEETYFEHMKNALGYAGKLCLFSLAVFTHAILPFLFINTASRGIFKMAQHMKGRFNAS